MLRDLGKHIHSVWLALASRILWKGRSDAAANPYVSMEELSFTYPYLHKDP